MNKLSLLRLSGAVLLSAVLAACAVAPTAPEKPRLVVFLAVDGLPQRQVLAYRDQLAPDGLARFLDRGAWFADAHYGHAVTVTAPGHATMLTGAYPHRTGIISNEWRDVNSRRRRLQHRRHHGHLHRPQDPAAGRHQPAQPEGRDRGRRAAARRTRAPR